MSNEVLNIHIRMGSPCGDDADIFDIADWAGHEISNLTEALAAMTVEDERLNKGWQEANHLLREQTEEVLTIRQQTADREIRYRDALERIAINAHDCGGCLLDVSIAKEALEI